jgi:hypothetical protein
MSWTQTWITPTLADFKSRFVRDFPYAPATDPANQDYVMDADITSAITQATATFNTAIGAADTAKTEMFLLLSAFFLVENLKTAQGGINSQAQFLAQSKSIGGVSVSYQIPENIAKDPVLSRFASNGYGMQYLTIVLPFLVGGMFVVEGATTNA